MQPKEYKAHSLEGLNEVASTLIKDFPEAQVILLRGEMGAGKTTFIKTLVAAMGSKDAVTSPTFSLVNEYVGANGQPIFHFDLYRIEDPEEIMDIGFYEYLDQGMCLIEWPEMAEQFMPTDGLEVQIEVIEGHRQFTVQNR